LTSPLDFIPVDMLDLQTNQLGGRDEKETIFRRANNKDFERSRGNWQYP